MVKQNKAGDIDLIDCDENEYGNDSRDFSTHEKRKRLAMRRKIERIQEERLLKEFLDDDYDYRSTKFLM